VKSIMTEASLRERICRLGRSLHDRGYAVGGAGNLSARLPDGGFLVTPTGSCLGRLAPDRLAHVDADGVPQAGPKPSKEFAFHHALYRERPQAGAVVHLHSTYLTALSCRRDLNATNAIRAFTPYYVMRIGALPVVPYLKPGDPEIARALAKLAATTSTNAFLLASHGPVVIGRDIEDAIDNAEELEETAKLFFLLRHDDIRYLTGDETAQLRT
jgi:ribulose-5-phosphate 4-epimerase/fuculose-1-phosphate aldolase